ncbi:DUF1543 domain-containing protein [Prochlorococcus sp. MIT 1341]|uniref:DUF1543 domain-containing protein n=1 Tax=Prochlorococcus sp. MIT 1341 TaxID=3096221 RepID=UPI002A758B49|nr:DUF1543 domain-containing protein [Prochlorococcus sp. MIT 1341]
MNLYIVVLGGRVKGGNIEMHDIRWVVGDTFESTFPELKSEWIGVSRGLHIDSFKLIKFVDGYRVKLVEKATKATGKANELWLVNLGGYKESEMLEKHHLEIVVADSAKKAKNKAQKKWTEPMKQVHKDNLYKIDRVKNYTVVLEKDPQNRSVNMQPDWIGYWVIG